MIDGQTDSSIHPVVVAEETMPLYCINQLLCCTVTTKDVPRCHHRVSAAGHRPISRHDACSHRPISRHDNVATGQSADATHGVVGLTEIHCRPSAMRSSALINHQLWIKRQHLWHAKMFIPQEEEFNLKNANTFFQVPDVHIFKAILCSLSQL